jgi:hypothetical protein
MRPRLRPNKGWRYRLILCDSDGDYVLDDFNVLDMVEGISILLLKDFRKMKRSKKIKVSE